MTFNMYNLYAKNNVVFFCDVIFLAAYGFYCLIW